MHTIVYSLFGDITLTVDVLYYHLFYNIVCSVL